MGIFNYRRPMIMVALLNIIGFLVLTFLNDGDYKVLIYGAAVLVMLELSYFVLCKLSMEDQYIFLIVAMLFSIGDIMLFRLDMNFGQKQVIWFALSLACFFIAYVIVLKTDILSNILILLIIVVF